jgi:hypothetical protein
MDCRNHPGAAAAAVCSGCAESYCDVCLVTVRGTRYCAHCKSMAVTGAPAVATTICPEANDALKYAALSFFCFGIVLGPVAISKALGAKKKIAADPSLSGEGRANAAMVMGALALVFWIIGMVQRASGRR